jgi:hypothetical protein
VDRKAAGNGPLSAELVDPHGDVLKMDRVNLVKAIRITFLFVGEKFKK